MQRHYSNRSSRTAEGIVFESAASITQTNSRKRCSFSSDTSEALSQLKREFPRASAVKDEYQLNPHLSLIYKTMPPEKKAEIANAVSFPFEEVRFDSAKAVISPADIKSREDVEAWRVVATQKLPG